MKKFTLVVAMMAAVAGMQSASAQTFTLGNTPTVISVTDPWLDSDVHIELTNNSNTFKKITVERIVNSISPGHLELFCFGSGVTGLCYPPGTDMSNGDDTINAGVTDHSFKGTLKPMGVYGQTSLHYRFSDTDNPGDSVGVDVIWDVTTSIGENNQQFGLSKPLQNPADAFTVFNFNLQSNDATDKIVVFNMLGSKVKTMDVPGKSGALVLTTSDLKAGVYMVSYMSNGKVKDTCRLVVSHR